MADARVPPSGPPARDPTAPARLLDAAAEVGLRVERAQREVDRLEAAVDQLALSSGASTGPAPNARSRAAGAPSIAAGASPAEMRDARALAIDLAVGGGSRSAIREQLSASFGLSDPDVVLGVASAGEGAATEAPGADDDDGEAAGDGIEGG